MTSEQSLATSMPLGETDRPESVTGDQRKGAWDACSDFVWKREREQIERWNQELDAMLTFAGLFSAALTAFTVPYYSASLTSSTTTEMLVHEPALIASIFNGSGVNLTQPPLVVFVSAVGAPRSASFGVPVRVNVLWFVALVFSLSAASIAIYVKQWLTQLGTPMTSMPRRSVVVWYRRHESVSSWGVKGIIAVVPILLQLSLVIFLFGLVVLLWTMDVILFIVVVILVGLLLAFSVFIAVIPSMAANCPYKSPQALLIVNVVENSMLLVSSIWIFCSTASYKSTSRRVYNDCLTMVRSIIIIIGGSFDFLMSLRHMPVTQSSAKDIRKLKVYGDWPEYESYVLSTLDLNPVSDSMLLAEAHALLKDDAFLDEVLSLYTKTSSLEDATAVLLAIYNKRKSASAENSAVDADAATQIANMVVGLIDRVRPDPVNNAISFPDSLLTLADELMKNSSSMAVFEALFRVLAFFERDDVDVSKVSTRILDNVARFAAQMKQQDFERLIDYIPLMLDRNHIRVALRITLEVLFAYGEHPELDRPRIGQQLCNTFEDYIPDANHASSSLFIGPSNIVPYLQILDSCLKVVEKRAEDFIKQLGDEIEKLSEQGGNIAGEEGTLARKGELRQNFQGQVAGFKRWRGIIPGIQSASREGKYIDYAAIASSLPLLFLQESDVFRFSSLFAM